MVGLSASWNVSGPQSGRAVISSDWLTEMKSFPAFLVCSLIAICTCAARPPTMNSHLSFSISSLVRWAPTAGLSWSSRNRISSLRPRIPPLALISSIATLAPCCWSLARAPKGPVVGPGRPPLIVSPPCALRIAGKAATAAPAAVVARNARRFIGRLLGESGADHRGGPLACQTQPGRAGRSHFAPTAGHPRSAPAPRAQLQISRARLPRVRHVGSRAKRPDDPRILTGRGRYVDDLILPRMVHVAFVRSVHAHARLGRVGVGAARRAPDVVGVLTGAEAARLCKPYRGVLAHYRGMKTGAMQPLAVERVRYVGEPIVAVAATSRAAAEDAARRVAVEYEPLPAVLDPGTALAPGAPLIHEALGDNLIYQTRLTAGDVAGALAAAHRVYTREFTIGRHTSVPVEPRSLVADYEPSTRALTLWISSQVPHMMQAALAELFSLPEQRVRVIAPDVGGSFGIKIHVYQDDLAACALAQVLGRPVKWVATRRESFLADIHARDQSVRVEVAAAADGTLTGMRAEITAAVGPYSAYPRSSVVEGGQVLRLLPGPYRLRNYDATLRVVAQNKAITSQYRAVGHPIATAVTESMVELIARDLGLDPAELRRRNPLRPDEFPYAPAGGNVYDSGSYHAALETLLEAAGYDALRGEQRAARAAGRAVGIGLSCFVELTGPGAPFYGVGGAPISGQEGTTVRLAPSGAVTVLTGVTDQGQGTRTALAQIVADELGVPLEAVAVLSGDTGVVPYGGGTRASRGLPIGGSGPRPSRP